MQPFQILIKPASGDCNQECQYCFYRDIPRLYYPETSIHRMSDDVHRNLIQKYLELEFQENVFSWQGGEPTLMGLDFFKRTIKYQEKFGMPGQSIGNALQTNGSLLDEEWAQFLHDNKFLVGISLDGPEKIHDASRGKGTWRKAMDAIELLQTHQVDFNILTVIHKGNFTAISRIYEFHLENGFKHLQFIPALDVDNQTGVAKNHSLSPEEYSLYLKTLFSEWIQCDESKRPRIRFFDALIRYSMKLDPGLCYTSPDCGRYLVVEHNGDIYPCDFFVKPSWYLGNISEDSWNILLKRRQKFVKKRQTFDHVCRTCLWWSLCIGGCIKDRLYSLNNHPSRTYFCDSLKAFFNIFFESIRFSIE
jgi:uncharacterized protein